MVGRAVLAMAVSSVASATVSMIAAIARRLLADMGSSAACAKPSDGADGSGFFSVKAGSWDGARWFAKRAVTAAPLRTDAIAGLTGLKGLRVKGAKRKVARKQR